MNLLARLPIVHGTRCQLCKWEVPSLAEVAHIPFPVSLDREMAWLESNEGPCPRCCGLAIGMFFTLLLLHKPKLAGPVAIAIGFAIRKYING